jgi:hypothetical protein
MLPYYHWWKSTQVMVNSSSDLNHDSGIVGSTSEERHQWVGRLGKSVRVEVPTAGETCIGLLLQHWFCMM